MGNVFLAHIRYHYGLNARACFSAVTDHVHPFMATVCFHLMSVLRYDLWLFAIIAALSVFTLHSNDYYTIIKTFYHIKEL